MDSKDDAKAQVVIPEAYFRKLKSCWDDAHRIGISSSSKDNLTPSSLSSHLQKEFRNIPRIRPSNKNAVLFGNDSNVPPRASHSAAVSNEEEEMDGGAHRGKGSVIQEQRTLNLGLSEGNTAGEGYQVPPAVADDHTEQQAAPADLRDVGSVVHGSVNDGMNKFVSAIPPPQPHPTIIQPKESITYDSREDWFYIR